MTKNYHINFYGSLPEQVGPNGMVSKDKIHFRNDSVHFETKAQMMEFFDDPHKITDHLKDTGVVKMMTVNYGKKMVFEPIVIVTPYFQAEGAQRVFTDEIREIDLGFPPLTQKILNKYGV